MFINMALQNVIKSAAFLLMIFTIMVMESCADNNPNPQGKEQPQITKPNIILYFCDDLGWGDTGCYGQQKIVTPNIDRMAAQGIRFTDAYTGSPVCAPSRSCLMSGLHAGHTRVRNNRSLTNKLVSFDDNTFTMAHLLQQAGYQTGLFGKWGLGEPGTSGIPTRQGFDEFYGFLDQRKAHHYYPDSLWHNDTMIAVPLSESRQYSSADWYFNKAKQFIQRHTDKPFFAYIPTQLPHLYMPYEPAEQFNEKPWPEGDKRWATMIATIDRQVGELLDLVDSLGIAENTLILFLSDNGGGNGQRIYYHDVRFFKSNAHFRGTKRDLYEGGIRVPFIGRWTGTIPKGQVNAEPVAYYDLMATFSELTREMSPQTDGVSLLDLFTGRADTLDRDYLYWEFPYMNMPNAKFAIRKGKYKAVKEYVGAEWQIYNLEDDPQELYNWIKEMPELAREMDAIVKKEHSPSPYWPIKGE